MKDKKVIAIVRCEIVSEVCPGAGCLNSFADKKAFFAQYESDTHLVGFFTCGGCSGRRVPRLIKKLLKYNLTRVHLSTCIMAKNDDGTYKCPFWQNMKKNTEKIGIEVIAGSH